MPGERSISRTKGALVLGGVVLCLVLTGTAGAATILAVTTGSDTYTTADYYGVQFAAGPAGEYIQSVTYDLSVWPGAFFDFDGDASFNNATAPLLGVLVGLTPADITWDLIAGSQPARLRFNFAPGTFGAGDWLRFAADTDYLVSDPAPGGVYGQAHVPLTVTLYGGFSNTTPFVQYNSQLSTLAMTVTPEPITLSLLALAVVAAMRRRMPK
jgi:hypothetical protein